MFGVYQLLNWKMHGETLKVVYRITVLVCIWDIRGSYPDLSTSYCLYFSFSCLRILALFHVAAFTFYQKFNINRWWSVVKETRWSNMLLTLLFYALMVTSLHLGTRSDALSIFFIFFISVRPGSAGLVPEMKPQPVFWMHCNLLLIIALTFYAIWMAYLQNTLRPL